MTRAVVFRTKGKLDLRSLTIFGVNAKPNTNSPIGYFGTGMKYAIAVLAREKIPVTIWIGNKKWSIFASASTFRDKEFQSIILHRDTLIPKKIQLPFTTELGKNWQLWQAYRELESNTIDEHGETYIHTFDPEDNEFALTDGTKIVVSSESFVQEHLDREKTFLPEALRRQESDEAVQVFDRPSKHIYYRGIRVRDLEKPALLTYNILQSVQLTEDRTLSMSYTTQWLLESFLVKCEDKKIIDTVVRAPEDSFENSFEWQKQYISAPSKVFIDTVKEVQAAAVQDESRPLRREVQSFAEAYTPTRPEPTREPWIDAFITCLEDRRLGHACEMLEDNPTIVPRLIEILKSAERERTHVKTPEVIEVPIRGDAG